MADFKNDLTGQRFGRLTVKEYAGNSKWTCVCDCGNETKVLTSKLKNGHTQSCGCLRRINMSKLGSAKAPEGEVVGRVYGYLEVIGYDPSTKVCTCKCECGNICEYDFYLLKSETKKSCGCKKKIRDNIGIRVCQACGKEFEGGARAFYCPECRAERKREQKRAANERNRKGHTIRLGEPMYCEMCNKKIIRNSANQRFCADCAIVNQKTVGRKQSLDYYYKNRDEINEKRKGSAFTIKKTPEE